MTADDEMDQLFSVIGNMLTHSDISARHLWKKIIFHHGPTPPRSGFTIFYIDQISFNKYKT